MPSLNGERWAVLIGVDFYMPGNGDKFDSLRGCVRDVEQVAEYLLEVLQVKPARIFKLTATAPDDTEEKDPIEKPAYRPTYKNMIRAVKDVTENANPGDLVYIHYSGHGRRVETCCKELKGDGGFDEALVPTDIRCGGRYLLDVEIAALLDGMVKRKLIVTVVLDSCYSGGSTRGAGDSTAVARAIDGSGP